MEVRAVPVLDDQGRIREWVGAHTDITDRVHAEEQLSQAQRLQAVGTLAGGVAHEVNNQLMAVLGFGEFVLGRPGAGASAGRRRAGDGEAPPPARPGSRSSCSPSAGGR